MIEPISLVLGMMSSLIRSWGMMPKLTYNTCSLKHEVIIITIFFWMRCFTMWWAGTEAEWRPTSNLQYITSWYCHLYHEFLREAFPCSTHKLSNNTYIVYKVVYIGMLPNTNMTTDIGPCSDDNLYVRSPYRWCVLLGYYDLADWQTKWQGNI